MHNYCIMIIITTTILMIIKTRERTHWMMNLSMISWNAWRSSTLPSSRMTSSVSTGPGQRHPHRTPISPILGFVCVHIPTIVQPVYKLDQQNAALKVQLTNSQSAAKVTCVAERKLSKLQGKVYFSVHYYIKDYVWRGLGEKKLKDPKRQKLEM